MPWITTAQTILISFSIIYLAAVILRSVKKDSCYYLLWVEIFPFSQYIALRCIKQLNFIKLPSFLPLFIICGIGLSILSDFILAIYMFRTEKNQTIAAHLEEIEFKRKLNRHHYQLIQKNEHETLEMCKVYLKQLNEAERILLNNSTDGLTNLTERLNQSIRQRRSDHFCQNIIVDALMHEKKALCQEKQIDLTLTIQLSESCPIAPLHLCSLFSNLMDNAIHACESLPQNQKRYIQIKTEQIQDYLCIYIKNSYQLVHSPLAKVQCPHHGYGLQILESICETYNGNMSIKKHKDSYETTILIQTIQEEPSL